MMKFFFFLLFSVCCNSLFSQTYYNIELLNKGQSITPEIAVGKGDISWHMTLNHSCRIEGNETNFSIHNFNTSLQLVIDMGYLTYLCGSFRVGDSLHIEAGITNPGHPLYGYRGRKSYAISQLGSQVYLGCNGINLLPHAMIRIGDTTVCGRNGDILRAYVLHAPSGYRIDWQDSRLRPLGGDSASIEGFPGDTVLSLSAILRDKDGKGLDTAYYKLKLKPLPEVEVTPSYRFCLQGEEYTFSGHFADGNDYHWVHRSYALSATSRKTVVFPEIMEDRDVRYELFVTDRTTGCRNSDTAWVYLRPKAPVIDIDTNTTRNDLRISWNADTNYTYSLMGIKWDGYGILEDYHLRHTFTGETDRFALSQKELDTLEFFYMTANRYIPALDRTISSASSDTVGYMKQFIKMYNSGKGTDNMIAYPFDMTGKGIVTNRDMCNKLLDTRLLGHDLSSGYWDFAKQSWPLDVYISDFGEWTGEAFNLIPGSVYILAVIDVSMQECELLMYGKLPPPFSYDLKTAVPGKTGSNIVMQPLSLIQKNRRQLIGEIIPHALSVGIFDYENQQWSLATHMVAINRWLPMISSENPPVLVKPWMPLLVTVSEIVNWKP